jgi:hypothetical protein
MVLRKLGMEIVEFVHSNVLGFEDIFGEEVEGKLSRVRSQAVIAVQIQEHVGHFEVAIPECHRKCGN